MAISLDVVILAAGQGKRMHSALPKVLHPLAGRPLVAHVLTAVRTLAPRAIVVVTGYGADAVEKELAAPDLTLRSPGPTARHRRCRAHGACRAAAGRRDAGRIG